MYSVNYPEEPMKITYTQGGGSIVPNPEEALPGIEQPTQPCYSNLFKVLSKFQDQMVESSLSLGTLQESERVIEI